MLLLLVLGGLVAPSNGTHSSPETISRTTQANNPVDGCGFDEIVLPIGRVISADLPYDEYHLDVA